MIRLVTQFDGPAARTSVAAPAGASGCCSSCCCCIVTAIGVSVFSAIHVRSVRRRVLDERPQEEPGPSAAPWPEVLGFFAFTLALLLGGVLAVLTGGWLSLSIPIIWGLLLYVAYRRVGDRAGPLHAVLTVICGVLLLVLEVVLWAAALGA